MIWQVVWTRPAAQDLRRLDRRTVRRIHQAVHQFAETGHGDLKRVRGTEREWRLRVSDWRVRFEYGPGTPHRCHIACHPILRGWGGPGPARCLVMLWPAGFERFFFELGQPADRHTLPPTPPGPPEMGRMLEAAARYALEFTP